MPRWLYYALGLAIVAPIINFVWGSQQAPLPLVIFICSILALIPLAALIGHETENLEVYVGAIAGGLLNATFGNAPELIIGIFALHAGLISVVQASITGSIISNALLVLGSSLAFGGWRWGRQYFNARDAGQYAAMMLLAVAGLLIPSTAFLVIHDAGRLQAVSAAIAVVLLIVYVLYLLAHVFRVRSERRTPPYLGQTLPPELPAQEAAGEEEAHPGQGDLQIGEHQASPKNWLALLLLAIFSTALLAHVFHVHAERSKSQTALPADEAHEVPPELSAPESQAPPKLWLTLLLLLLATLGTAWNSALLVGTIEPVTKILGWSPVFVGLVIIPIVGNVSEHTSALYIALRDHIDLSMAIAAGSSIQVATLVAPLLVIISLFLPHHMNLVFQPLELVMLGVAVLLFSIVSLDGESSWLAGVQLMAIY
ncbi:MAG: calcium:proton antiporter, partial [Ktedonobacteraceae bacterium]